MTKALVKRLLPVVLALGLVAGCVRDDNPVLEGTPPTPGPSVTVTASPSP